MSHCRDFEEAWWEAAEGRPLSAAANAHLRTCESCRATMRRLAAATHGFAALRAVEAPDPSAAVWQRVRRPVRRPAFALAWAAGAVVCIIAGTFALRHAPAPQPPAPASPVERIARAPEVSPVTPSVKPSAPEQVRAPVGEITQPGKVRTRDRRHGTGGGGRLASTHRNPRRVTRHEEQRPEAPPQTPLVEAPSGGAGMVVEAAAGAPCSKTAALAYRAIGRALVARFLSSNGETGQIEHSVG